MDRAAHNNPLGGGDVNPASNGHTTEHQQQQQPDQDVPDGVKQPPQPPSADCQTPAGAPGQQPTAGASNQAGPPAGQQQPPSMNSMNTANAGGEATDTGGDSFLNEFKEEGGNQSKYFYSIVVYFKIREYFDLKTLKIDRRNSLHLHKHFLSHIYS